MKPLSGAFLLKPFLMKPRNTKGMLSGPFLMKPRSLGNFAQATYDARRAGDERSQGPDAILVSRNGLTRDINAR